MQNINESIFKKGRILNATKLPVITIGIGPVYKLKDLDGIIWHDNGKVVIKTKEAPIGCMYEQERTAVVRFIDGKVKMNGLYDIYAPKVNKIEKLLSNPFQLNSLSKKQLEQLKPVLDASSEIRPSIAPEEQGRKVIVVTDEMVVKQGYINCHCPWDADDVMTKLFVGDIFLVEDEETFQGYRIGKQEFEETHKLD